VWTVQNYHDLNGNPVTVGRARWFPGLSWWPMWLFYILTSPVWLVWLLVTRLLPYLLRRGGQTRLNGAHPRAYAVYGALAYGSWPAAFKAAARPRASEPYWYMTEESAPRPGPGPRDWAPPTANETRAARRDRITAFAREHDV
jgi:hypothetical protein